MKTSLLAVAMAMLLAVPTARAQSPEETGKKVVDKASKYLLSRQKPDGSFQQGDREPPAVSAMAMRVLAQNSEYGPQSAEVQKTVKWLLALQKEDGGFYRDMLANYNTAIIVSALAQIKDPKLQPHLQKAAAFLKAGQTIGDADEPEFGGWNYGGLRGGMVDVSNTATVLEALHDAGLKPDDPAYQNAIKFLSKLQNNSETNPSAWAGNDGGFIYNPGRNGEGHSSAGEVVLPDGRKMPRSYGSMTYAGLKSYIYAGLKKDDPRVKAAVGWITNNWTLDANPGMGEGEKGLSGVFYYYHTFAAGLDAYDEPVITDANGTKHDWRQELLTKLASLQKTDGSFQGTKQWMEDNSMIATTLATLAAQQALKDLAEHPAK